MAGQDHARAGPAGEISPADCRAWFDAVSDAILIHDARTGAILDVNQGMCEMFGYTPEEARRLTLTALCGDAAKAPAEGGQSLLAQAAAGSPQVFECQARDRAGRVFWVEVHLKSIKPEGGGHILAMLRDIDQRKQAEEALQTQTRVLESMAEGVTVIDGSGRIIYANPAFDAMYGYKPGELIGQHVSVLSDFSASESLKFAQEMVRELAKKGILSGEVRNRKKDGTRFYTQARISALEISGKSGWILVQEDITERRQMEEALRESEASYRVVTEGSLAGVYLIQDGKFRYVNPVLAQALGYSPDELMDRLGPLDLVHPEDRPGMAEDMRRLLAEEEAKAHNKFRGVRRDGSVIFGEVLARQVEYQGRPAIMGTFLDVTERRLAEEALKKSEEKYRTIFDKINDAIAVIDPQTGALLEVNQKFTESGYKPEEVKHLTVADLCSADPPFRAQEGWKWLRKAIEEGPQIYEWQAEDRQGRRIWVEINLSLVPLGGQDRLLAVVRDISERKQVEDIRRGMEESLRQSEAKYRTLVEQMPAITYVISLGEKVEVLYISPQIETLLGFSPEEWGADTFETWKRQLHPEDRERVLATIARSGESREPFAMEYRVLAKDGRVVWFRDEARVVQDQEGEFLLLQGLALDITERKRAEAALRETTQTLQALIQAAPLAIIALDRDFEIRLWNPEAERMFGWQESEVLGRHLPFFEESQWVESQARIQRQMAGEVEAAMELPRVRKDGSRVDTSLWTATLRNPEGVITGLVGILADVTARKRAEEELRQQANLLDLAHDAIVVRDLDNRIGFWNSGAEEIYGWGREEVQGQETHQLWQTEFAQPRGDLEAEFFRRGQWQGELIHTRRDGQRIVVASRWALQRDKEGKPAAILEINRDITERKRAEAGRARSAAILDATSDLVGTADLKGRVLYLNRAGRKMLGIGRDEEVSRLRVKDLQPEWAYRLVIEQGGAEARRYGVWSGETAFLTRSSQQIPTSQVIVAHRDPQGKVDFYSTIARDITASRRAAEALQESEQKLRLLTARLLSIQEQERRRVARELHDELGQALTVLKMHLVGIEEQLSSDQQSQRATCEQMLSYIDTVIENVRRLSWDLSPSSLEDLGLSAALGYLVDEICRNHNLQSQVAMDKIDHLFSPETQINIYRIFQESLTNVVKHARASLVAVKVTKENGKVSFKIRDNGRGFDLKRALSRKVPPKSLGLTAMNERAHMAAGSLQISSRKGRGTTIKFTIPTDNRVK
jgi:PAS domain S-box-containing protein